MDEKRDQNEPLQTTQPMLSNGSAAESASSAASGGSLTVSLSESQLAGQAPLTGTLRAVDLTNKMMGEFRLLRRLGSGGMAEVWLAEQTSLKRQVAVKVMRPTMSGDVTGRKRFENEAFAAAALHHPNIVQVFAVGEAEGVQFIAQEYVPGMNMRDYIAKKGPPALETALHLMKQVAAALDAANDAGIVHRDIKPENILLTQKGQAKVADFGLAQLRQSDDAVRMTQTGMTLGTPLYMSPEQVQGKKLDHRSDLYSMGVTFYHLLTGRPPFRGESAFAIAYNHVHTEPPRIDALRPDVSPGLGRLISRLMSKKPEERCATARDVLRELRELEKSVVLQDGDWDANVPLSETIPFVAVTDQPPANVMNWWKANARTWVAFVLAALLVGTVSIGAGAWSRNRSAIDQPRGPLVRVPRQLSPKDQLELAQREDRDDAWWAILVLFPGHGAEQQEARRVLIPRLIQQHRLREAARLCDELIEQRGASPNALAVAWAGKALIQALHDNWGLAQKSWNERVRDRMDQLPPVMLEWWHEIEQSHVRPQRGPGNPPRGQAARPRASANPPR